MIVAVVGFLYSIYLLLPNRRYLFNDDDWLFGVFIFYRHRANIGRIKAGTEPKVKWL